MTDMPLLRLLAQAHPNRAQGDLLAMLEAIPEKAQKPAVQRRVGSRPKTAASLERRRSWAAAGRLPPALATRFTLAEVAVLAVVSMEVAKHGACTLTIGHIAAVAGVSETTVRNALREAKALGLVTVEERRRTAWMNYPNRIQIVSKEWASWLRLHGCRSVKPTPNRIHSDTSRPSESGSRAAEGVHLGQCHDENRTARTKGGRRDQLQRHRRG